ncbi:MAG: site-2 protease family protein [Candidatus Alcyoniella australis]|nr:site-2 protease family protein [Candidatus Alcyoniella australis]
METARSMDLGLTIDDLRRILIALPGIIIAVTYHEAAHAWMADRCGDNTARSLGRISANPLRHIDPLGTIVVPLVLYVTTGFVFGWAKPVPVVMRNFHHMRRDMILTALAGPVTNFALALLCTSLYYLLAMVPPGTAAEWIEPLKLAAQTGVFINVLLGVFNMIPVPPLDGGRVAVGLLPPRQSMALARLERFGILIVLMLLWLPPTRVVLSTVFGALNILIMYVVPYAQTMLINAFGHLIQRLL